MYNLYDYTVSTSEPHIELYAPVDTITNDSITGIYKSRGIWYGLKESIRLYSFYSDYWKQNKTYSLERCFEKCFQQDSSRIVCQLDRIELANTIRFYSPQERKFHKELNFQKFYIPWEVKSESSVKYLKPKLYYWYSPTGNNANEYKITLTFHKKLFKSMTIKADNAQECFKRGIAILSEYLPYTKFLELQSVEILKR